MNDKEKFVKLPGKGRVGAFDATTYFLYMGATHLLHVARNRFSENYKWFAFENIQAFVIQKTNRGAVINFVCGLMVLMWGIFSVMADSLMWGGDSFYIFLVLTIVCAAILCGNVIAGPTCRTFMRTSVKVEELYSLGRVRPAGKAVSKMAEVVRGLQGALPDDVSEMDDMVPVAAGERSAFDFAEEREQSDNVRPFKAYEGRAHQVLFSLLVADVCHSAVRFYFGNIIMEFLSLVIMFALIFCVVRALVKQHGTNLPSAIKALTWGSLGYLSAIMLTAYAKNVYDTPSNMMKSFWEIIEEAAAETAATSLYLRVILIVSVLVSGVIGFVGLYLLNRFEKMRAVPPERASETLENSESDDS